MATQTAVAGEAAALKIVGGEGSRRNDFARRRDPGTRSEFARGTFVDGVISRRDPSVPRESGPAGSPSLLLIVRVGMKVHRFPARLPSRMSSACMNEARSPRLAFRNSAKSLDV